MDVRKCYFQASCFVQYWNDVISSYLIWLYLHHYHDRYDAMMSDEQTANDLKMDLKRYRVLVNPYIRGVCHYECTKVTPVTMIIVAE